jgi:hypothetical protein
MNSYFGARWDSSFTSDVLVDLGELPRGTGGAQVSAYLARPFLTICSIAMLNSSGSGY